MTNWRAITVAIALAGCSDAAQELTAPPPAPPPPPPSMPSGAAVIAFVSTRDGDGPEAGYQSVPWIYLAAGDGSSVQRLTRGEAPAWSPDGERLAFHRWRSGVVGGGDVELVVSNRDGTGQRVLATGGFYPAWSPDGTTIAYNTGVGVPGAGIYAVNVDGASSPKKLIDYSFALPDDGYGPGWVGFPSWSPDGNHIAFVRANYGIPWMVYVMKSDGSDPKLLSASFSVGDTPPRWKPDGSRLLLMVPQWSTGAGQWSIVSVALDGSDMRRHVDGAYVAAAAWFADGNSIAYQTFSAPATSTWPYGSRMRIYASTLGEGTRRQLIPDAVNPANPEYWDTEPALWGVVGGGDGDSGAGDWDYLRGRTKGRVP